MNNKIIIAIIFTVMLMVIIFSGWLLYTQWNSSNNSRKVIEDLQSQLYSNNNQEIIEDLQSQLSELQQQLNEEKSKKPEVITKVINNPNSVDNSIKIETCKSKYLEQRNYDSMEDFQNLSKQALEGAENSDGQVSFKQIMDYLEDQYFQNKYQECINQ